jgi:ketosteroid isomerase-like protein
MSARTAQQVHELFAKYFSAGDLDGLISLYEPGATLVPQPGVVVSGHAGIRGALNDFLALKGQFELQLRTAFQSGDIALLLSTWSLKGSDASGAVVELSGQTSDVVRQQADGTWLVVIDNPYGAESVSSN